MSRPDRGELELACGLLPRIRSAGAARPAYCIEDVDTRVLAVEQVPWVVDAYWFEVAVCPDVRPSCAIREPVSR
jgi:hypothetical protein